MSAQARSNLIGLTHEQLIVHLSMLGEKPFRARQLMKWIHQRGIVDFEAMTDISKPLRKRLSATTELLLPEIVQDYPSSDGSHKWIIRIASGSQVEMVYIPEAGRGTLCVSSQAGCSLDCSFCATGKQGFDSNLSSAEIVGQLWLATAQLGGFGPTAQRPISNVVMMGMGEPLLNFDNVMAAVNLMMDDCAWGLSKRRVTISTAGVVPAILRMQGQTDASLAISLHAPNDELRSQLVPINRRYPIRELLAAVRVYMDSLPDRRVPVIEYTLIKGINDHRRHARELAALLETFPCKINLIPFNPFEMSDFETPADAAVSNFRQILKQAGFTVTVRTTRADDISAACGQLVGAVADRTRRQDRYRRKLNENPDLAMGNFIICDSGRYSN